MGHKRRCTCLQLQRRETEVMRAAESVLGDHRFVSGLRRKGDRGILWHRGRVVLAKDIGRLWTWHQASFTSAP